MEKTELSEAELKQFTRDMCPAKPVDDVGELKEKLECGFYGDDDEDDEDECTMDRESQWLNFSIYARKVGGIAWVNALHDFDGDGKEVTPLIYVLRNEPDDWRTVVFLIQSLGADPNIRDSQGQPPLWVFLTSGMMMSYKSFNCLLEAGANALISYRGKGILELAKEIAEMNSDRVGKMVWNDLQRKYDIDE
jgi:hypothetical protein